MLEAATPSEVAPAGLLKAPGANKEDDKRPNRYGVYLWLFTVLLFFRVIGQIVVVLFAPRWLPPMEQWQSGLLPYPVLLAGQAVVLTLMVWISADFSRGAGFFLRAVAGGGSRDPLVQLPVLWRDDRPLRNPDDAPAGPALAGRHDSHHFSHVVAAFLWTFATYHVG